MRYSALIPVSFCLSGCGNTEDAMARARMVCPSLIGPGGNRVVFLRALDPASPLYAYFSCSRPTDKTDRQALTACPDVAGRAKLLKELDLACSTSDTTIQPTDDLTGDVSTVTTTTSAPEPLPQTEGEQVEEVTTAAPTTTTTIAPVEVEVPASTAASVDDSPEDGIFKRVKNWFVS